MVSAISSTDQARVKTVDTKRDLAHRLSSLLATSYNQAMSNFDPEITPEMKARYIERRKNDAANLENALAKGDFKTMTSVAHQIKGNAATFSFNDLESIAIALEKAAAAQAHDACEKQIHALRAWLVTTTTQL